MTAVTTSADPSEHLLGEPPRDAEGAGEQQTKRRMKEQQKAGARALRDLLKPVSATLTAGRSLAVVSGVLAVVPYIALVRIGEVLLDAHAAGLAVDGAEVNRWLGILLGAFGLRLVIYFVALSLTHMADARFGHLVRLRMVERFARVPLGWFTSTNSGRVRKALQDEIGTVHQLIAHKPVDGTNAVVMPIALMVYAFVIDWRLGLLTIATLPFYIGAMMLPMIGMGEKTVEMDQRLSTVSARMVEFVTGIAVVKAFGRVGRAHRSYQDAADEFYAFYLDWVKPLIRVSALATSFLAVPLVLLVNIGVGSLLVHSGAVTAADVLATALIALLIPYALEVLMNSMWAQQLAGGAALRLVDLLDTPVLPDGETGSEPRSHEVVFDHVSYSYGAETTSSLAIEDVSFTLREGTVTALVGPSGSGKSTIATLLARFDDPGSGTISIGGVPVAQITDLYSRVGFVLQDPQLLRISLRDNIALGRPDATDTQIREAAAAAQILDEIEALPQGFDTIYGKDTALSGGQAQRVSIARALLVDAPVLVLDEATALTDPESQHEIQQALSALARGRTVLLIAHRPEVITGVDQIILIDSGRITATGTHDELLAEPGYAQLWRDTGAELTTGTPEGDRR
ncbi:ABC transporter ATP-binding protein [Nocardia sp. NPDC058176]|uniref:ABC transporter ATP-binding protein n=1 Tax=Nocardia sp. NPDC058176 TaxID=3346368 RepID=UPI0036D95573